MELNLSHYCSAGEVSKVNALHDSGTGAAKLETDSHHPGLGFSGPRGDFEKAPCRISPLW